MLMWSIICLVVWHVNKANLGRVRFETDVRYVSTSVAQKYVAGLERLSSSDKQEGRLVCCSSEGVSYEY